MKKLLLACVVALFSASYSHAVVAHTVSNQGFCTGGANSGMMGATCSSTNTTTFSFTAGAANRAVLFFVGCGSTAASMASVTLTASGWTTTQLSGPTGSASASWGASFGAIAPNTSAATFTVTWATTCSSFMDVLADEFSGNDTTGGTTTFDAHNQATASGSCTVTVTPANNDDGLWGACFDTATAVGSGFTKGADDTQSDWSEWKILSGGSGAGQTVNFTGSGNYVVVGATVKPAGGAVACKNRIALLGAGCT